MGIGALVLALGGGIFALTRSPSSSKQAATTTIPVVSTTSPSTTTPTQTTTPPTTLVSPTSTTLASLPPDDVLVEVYNGTGQTDLATSVAKALSSLGFHINGTGDAASATYTASVIEYEPGNEAGAEAVALHLLGTTRLVEDDSLPAQDEVNLIVGDTYDGVVGT